MVTASSFEEPEGVRSSIYLSDGTKLLNSEKNVLSHSSHSRRSFIVLQMISNIRKKYGGEEVPPKGRRSESKIYHLSLIFTRTADRRAGFHWRYICR